MSGFLAQWPLRIATGAFIANSGLEKLNADADAAAQTHGMASGTYPFLADVPPEQFNRALAIGEVTLGSALLTPFVPGRVAGAGLSLFATGLLGLYVRTPGLRQEGSVRPSTNGIAIAKDVWLLGAGLSLIGFDRYRRRQRA